MGGSDRNASAEEITGEVYSNKADILFEALAEDSYCFFLDSGCDPGKLGRYSIIGSRPRTILRSLKEVGEFLSEEEVSYSGRLPFVGGLVGYIGYESNAEFGFFDKAVVCDNQEGGVWLVSCDNASGLDAFRHRFKLPSKATVKAGLRGGFSSNFTKDEYVKAVGIVKEYIREGDAYQVNLSQRFSADYDGSGWGLYKRLRRINPAPFAAYLNFGSEVLCSSPERFLRVKDGLIETRPIKGTRPRGINEADDRRLAAELMASEKDRAEHLMIVDLERNDLGRVCEYGSIDVPEFEILESYPTVHHMVSTVRGRLRKGVSPMDCIRSCFPGGSITGAPKVRAMEIIDELEPTERGVYTGSIGYICLSGRMDLNIVIRTIVYGGGKAYFNVGGGIVADSDPQLEYDETIDKARALFQALGVEGHHMKAYINGEIVDEDKKAISHMDYGLLYGFGLFETMRAKDGRVLRIDRHLARLRKSAETINLPMPWSDDDIKRMIELTLKENRLADAYLRATITRGAGEPRLSFKDDVRPTIAVIARKLPRDETPARLAFSKRYSVYSKDPRCRIKSTNYLLNVLAKAEARERGVDDIILLNEKGDITECSTANLFLVRDGKLITPSEESGLLPGITREAVLEIAEGLALPVEVRTVASKEAAQSQEMFKTSSITGITPVIEVDGNAVGDGRPGKTTEMIRKRYQELAD